MDRKGSIRMIGGMSDAGQQRKELSKKTIWKVMNHVSHTGVRM